MGIENMQYGYNQQAFQVDPELEKISQKNWLDIQKQTEIENIKNEGIEAYIGKSVANGNSIISENEKTEKQGYYKTITVTDYTDLEGKTDKTKDIVKKVNVKITYMFKAKEQTVELSTILTKEN